MSAVWGTIRDALKAAVYTDFNAMPFERESAMLDAMAADLEAKLPLITLAHAAVVEAAKVMADYLKQPPRTDSYAEYLAASRGLLDSVATLRELEGTA